MNTSTWGRDDGAVRHLVLCRSAEFNTITEHLRAELDAGLDEADADDEVRVVLLRAEGRAVGAGFGLSWAGLGWSTMAQAAARVHLRRRGQATQEVLDFVAHAAQAGWRDAVRERGRPFGDYGERP